MPMLPVLLAAAYFCFDLGATLMQTPLVASGADIPCITAVAVTIQLLGLPVLLIHTGIRSDVACFVTTGEVSGKCKFVSSNAMLCSHAA